jgi:hypothetical protein
MLQSPAEHFRRQQQITAAGLRAASRARADLRRLTAVVTLYQETMTNDALTGVDDNLSEQGLDAPLEARVNPAGISGTASDGRPLDSLLDVARQSDKLGFALIVTTQLKDAARIAAGISIAARPKVQGYVRMISPPCCPRCALLAGKWFGWNAGFQRHPNCDCRHIPTAEDHADDIRTDPQALFKSGQIRGLTKAETKALGEGADIGQIINARRSIYMDPAGRRFTRESTTKRGIAKGLQRPTPEQIYRDAGDDRDAAIRLLKRFSYLF